MFVIRLVNCSCVLLPSQGHRRQRPRQSLHWCTCVTCDWADLWYNSRFCKSCQQIKCPEQLNCHLNGNMSPYSLATLLSTILAIASLSSYVRMSAMFTSLVRWSFLLKSSACFIRSWYSIRTRNLRPCQIRWVFHWLCMAWALRPCIVQGTRLLFLLCRRPILDVLYVLLESSWVVGWCR